MYPSCLPNCSFLSGVAQYGIVNMTQVPQLHTKPGHSMYVEKGFFAPALFEILFNYRGKAYYVVNLLEAPPLTLTHWAQVRVALKYPNVIKHAKKVEYCCPLYYFFQLEGLG